MKKNLFLAGLLTTFSLVAKSQVGINTNNPQGIFNVDGLKNNPATGVPTAAQSKDDLVMTSNGNLGLGLTTPGTTLDVNGAITNRETALAVAGNAVTIPVNVSLVRLTGTATAAVAITAPAAPNPGQRLIVYNNTTGGFGATLDGVTIPNNTIMEFVFTNSFWRTTDGGMLMAGPTNIYTANGTLEGNRTVTTAGNLLSFTNGSNKVSVGTTGTEGIVRATGSSRGSFLADGGNATLSMYANDNGKALVAAYGNSTSLDMGSSTAIPVNLFTNNTQRMTVDSGGNVGVGTTTPDTKLTISTPDNSFGLNHTNGTVNLKTYIGGGAGYVGTTTSNTLNLMTNNGARMTITPSGNVGVGASTPGTTLDVNGAITNRETALAVAGNAVTIPVNVSLVRLTGTATAAVAITAPTAPNPGQRLIVYNNTTGGFGATLDGTTVPNGKALEFVFSNSFWRSTDGGSTGAAPVNIYTADGALAGNRTVTTAGNSLSFTNGTNSVVIETTGTDGTVRANGSSKGSVLATGGTSTLNMVATDNDKGIVMTSGNNTGLDIGSYTADPVSILTNNLYRMTVDSGGNVGVGTTTPDTKLTISTPDNSFGLNHTNGTVNLKTYIGGGAGYVGTTTSNNLNLMTNNTRRIMITSAGDVGIGTDTPQKKLHVSGSLQIDNELSVGGTNTTPGSSGTNGQFLISKGPGLAPQWTSVSIPIPAPGTYNLRGVYNFDLNDVFTNTNNTNLILGTFNNIKVDTGNNLVVIEFQSSTSVLSLNSGEAMSYRYRLSGNNGISSTQSPYFYLLPSGFAPMNNLTSYKFYLKDLPLNTYNLTLEAFRTNTQGAATPSKFIHFNRTYNDSTNFTTDGKAIVYVYEL